MCDSQIKSSTIMFTDVFGYSRMVGSDEKHALKLLDKHNKIITNSIKSYNGSVVKFIGDAVFSEFKKPEDASHCAVNIQQKFIQRNKINSKNDRIHIRIGLHMGDLVVKGDDLFGNTVNLGSRIESVAPVDGILVSQPIHDAIKEDPSLFTKELGFVKLKNITDPTQLYKLYLDQLGYTAQSDEDLRRETLERGVKVVDMGTYSPLDVYSIGMMYFINLGDSEDEVLCRGITQDILKDMAQINSLRIPSATEIDQYQDTDLPISEVARRMQAEYMLIGSILKKGETFTLSLEMKDMKSGTISFEETFTFKSIEINSIKGEILLKVLDLFDLELPEHVQKYFEAQPTSNPKAMEHYMKARHLMDIPRSHDLLQKARDHFLSAIKLDPAFLYAQTNKGYISYLEGNYDSAEEEFFFALDLASQDNLETSDAYVYGYLGILYNRLEKFNKSIRYLEKGIDIHLKYNNRRQLASKLHNLGFALNESGKSKEGLDCFQRSLSIKEEFEDRNVLASSYNQIANTYNTLGDYSLSIENARRSIGYYKSLENRLFGAYTMIVLSDSYSRIGMFTECTKHLEIAQDIFEEFNNVFLLGKVDVLHGMKYFNKGEIDKAISYYVEGIEKMQLDESRKYVLHHSIELIHIFIYDKKYDKAQKYMNRCRLLIKKTHNVDPEYGILIDALEMYIEFLNSKEDIEKLEQFYIALQKDTNADYYSWYYLAKTFSIATQESKAEECSKKARDLLTIKENKISDASHRDSFINSLLLHQEIAAQHVPTKM